MQALKQLEDLCRRLMQKHPKHKLEIIDIYSMCRDEVEDGNYEQHEVDLAEQDLTDLDHRLCEKMRNEIIS